MLSDKQKAAYFKLLMRRAKDSTYTGLNASRRSNVYEDDVSCMETMKNQAMLDIGKFTTTKRFVDWVINYINTMRSTIAHANVFKGTRKQERGRVKDGQNEEGNRNKNPRENHNKNKKNRDETKPLKEGKNQTEQRQTMKVSKLRWSY